MQLLREVETKIFKRPSSKPYLNGDVYGLFGFGQTKSIDGTHQREA